MTVGSSRVLYPSLGEVWFDHGCCIRANFFMIGVCNYGLPIDFCGKRTSLTLSFRTAGTTSVVDPVLTDDPKETYLLLYNLRGWSRSYSIDCLGNVMDLDTEEWWSESIEQAGNSALWVGTSLFNRMVLIERPGSWLDAVWGSFFFISFTRNGIFKLFYCCFGSSIMLEIFLLSFVRYFLSCVLRPNFKRLKS